MNTTNLSSLLNSLEKLLLAQGEGNWVRGIVATRQALQQGNEEDARTMYFTMNQGAGSFADYNLWHEDPEVCRRSNAELDRLREELWSGFEL